MCLKCIKQSTLLKVMDTGTCAWNSSIYVIEDDGHTLLKMMGTEKCVWNTSIYVNEDDSRWNMCLKFMKQSPLLKVMDIAMCLKCIKQSMLLTAKNRKKSCCFFCGYIFLWDHASLHLKLTSFSIWLKVWALGHVLQFSLGSRASTSEIHQTVHVVQGSEQEIQLQFPWAMTQFSFGSVITALAIASETDKLVFRLCTKWGGRTGGGGWGYAVWPTVAYGVTNRGRNKRKRS